MMVDRFKPTVLTCTPSYALHLGRVMAEQGPRPGARARCAPSWWAASPPPASRERARGSRTLWGARLVEFYGCTEVSPHCGGYSCPASDQGPGPVTSHLMEDTQIWELVDPDTRAPRAPRAARGLTVCTNLNSESSPQLRFLVGDYATFSTARCACGRTHVRAVGAFAGRADDLINLRGIKMYPVQLEEAVRAVPGVGDEYEIVLVDGRRGARHHDGPGGARRPGRSPARVAQEIRSRCEVRARGRGAGAAGTLPKTEFKARRVRDLRRA